MLALCPKRAASGKEETVHATSEKSSFVNTRKTIKHLTCGNTVPEMGLELRSRP